MNSVVFLQAAGGNPLVSLLPWVGVFIVMYLFMIRPQVKKNKELKKFRENLTEGDKVVTIGGIHGKIRDLAETTVLLETEGGKIRLEKAALSPSGTVEIGKK